jgi:hypothetical protein
MEPLPSPAFRLRPYPSNEHSAMVSTRQMSTNRADTNIVELPVQRLSAYPKSVFDVFSFMLGFYLDSRGQIYWPFPSSPTLSICATHYEPLTYLSARYAIQTAPFQEFASDYCLCESLYMISFGGLRFRYMESQHIIKRQIWRLWYRAICPSQIFFVCLCIGRPFRERN